MLSDAAEGQTGVERIYPLWQSFEWTPRQRRVAIRSLFLIAMSYGLLAITSTGWGAGAFAANTVVPIGLTLLCFGTVLLTSVFWYAYKHGHNSVGDNASAAMTAYVMLVVAGLVALVTLALQLIGLALVAIERWPSWRFYSPISYLAPVAVCVLISLCLSVEERILPWRPTRDPDAPDSELSVPVTGARLALRWVIMLVAQNSWTLIGVPLYVLGIVGRSAPIPGAVGVLAVVGAIFLLAALSELTHRA